MSHVLCLSALHVQLLIKQISYSKLKLYFFIAFSLAGVRSAEIVSNQAFLFVKNSIKLTDELSDSLVCQVKLHPVKFE